MKAVGTNAAAGVARGWFECLHLMISQVGCKTPPDDFPASSTGYHVQTHLKLLGDLGSIQEQPGAETVHWAKVGCKHTHKKRNLKHVNT